MSTYFSAGAKIRAAVGRLAVIVRRERKTSETIATFVCHIFLPMTLVTHFTSG
jgi:hypothetical protein